MELAKVLGILSHGKYGFIYLPHAKYHCGGCTNCNITRALKMKIQPCTKPVAWFINIYSSHMVLAWFWTRWQRFTTHITSHRTKIELTCLKIVLNKHFCAFVAAALSHPDAQVFAYINCRYIISIFVSYFMPGNGGIATQIGLTLGQVMICWTNIGLWSVWSTYNNPMAVT